MNNKEVNRIRLEGLLERGRMLSKHLQATGPMAAKTVNDLLIEVIDCNRHIFSPSDDANFCKHCGGYFTAEWHWRTTEEQSAFHSQNEITSSESR